MMHTMPKLRCPMPRCQALAPMHLQSLRRHWCREEDHPWVFNVKAAFTLCGSCGQLDHTVCGCSVGEPILQGKELVDLLATNLGVSRSFL